MKLTKLLLLTLITLIVTAGCSGAPDYSEVNSHIKAQGVQLGLEVNKVFELLDDQPDEEMCVYGYEYFFENSGLNIGFRLDQNTVRRVTVRNTHDSIYTIQVGDKIETVSQTLEDFGYAADETTQGRFVKDDLYFTPVSKDGQTIDQLIIEVINDDII